MFASCKVNNEDRVPPACIYIDKYIRTNSTVNVLYNLTLLLL